MSASSSANPNLEHPLAILGRAIEAGSFRPPSQASPAHATATHAASGGRSADLSRCSSASSAGFGPDQSQLPALRAAVAQALSPHRPAANHQPRPAGNMSQSPTIAGSTRPRTGIMTGATMYGQQGSAVASRGPGINVGGHTPFVQDAVARRSLSASSQASNSRLSTHMAPVGAHTPGRQHIVASSGSGRHHRTLCQVLSGIPRDGEQDAAFGGQPDRRFGSGRHRRHLARRLKGHSSSII